MPRPTRRAAAFSLTDLLVVIVAISAILVSQLPTEAASRRTARRMQNSTQLRGIHQAMFTFANSNREKFPGLNSRGMILTNGAETTGNSGAGDTVQARYWILLRGEFFTPEYAISPSETASVTEYDGWGRPENPPVQWGWDDDPKHYSYAMLGIKGNAGQAPGAQGRAVEWTQSLNTQAIVVSDRNTGFNATDRVNSIHDDDPGEWKGSVLWNDNHVQFENTQYFETKYGTGRLMVDADWEPIDNLFSADDDPDGRAGFDALMPIADDDVVDGRE